MATVRPDLPPLRTPLTAPLLSHYPSELRSPAVGTPTYIKREDVSMKTPITPPAAYLDFLTKLSPTIPSPYPQSAGGQKRFFTFEKALPSARLSPPLEKPNLTSMASSESITSSASGSSFSSGSSVLSLATVKTIGSSREGSPIEGQSSNSVKSDRSSENARPASADAAVAAAVAASGSTAPAVQQASRPAQSSSMAAPPLSAHAIHPPPSPFNRLPTSARTPRRLHIPQSPFTPTGGPVRSPLSATTTQPLYSPFSATMSPREWESLERVGSQAPPLSAGIDAVAAATAAAVGTGCSTPVSAGPRGMVRQVVTTRTVTYATRKPAQAPIVEPVPAWKKRKVGP